MSAEEIVDLGFDGLRKQRTRSLAQNIRELIVECSWLNQFRDGIVRHGISLLQWRSGGSSTPTICRLTDSCRHQLLAIARLVSSPLLAQSVDCRARKYTVRTLNKDPSAECTRAPGLEH